MPHFRLPITDADPLYKIAFSLAVLAPDIDPDSTPDWMSAYVIEQVQGCTISEELAHAYDPTIVEGDVLFLTLIQSNADSQRLHSYRLGIAVKFTGGRGRIIRIGRNYLLSAFDITHVLPDEHDSPEAEHLLLQLRTCVAGPADGEDLLQI